LSLETCEMGERVSKPVPISCSSPGGGERRKHKLRKIQPDITTK
jgi:hypothetical protein